jgi:hypothetical protein
MLDGLSGIKPMDPIGSGLAETNGVRPYAGLFVAEGTPGDPTPIPPSFRVPDQPAAPPPAPFGSGGYVQPLPPPAPFLPNPAPLPPPDVPPIQTALNTPRPEPGRYDPFAMERIADPSAPPPIPPAPPPFDDGPLPPRPAGPDWPPGSLVDDDGSVLVPAEAVGAGAPTPDGFEAVAASLVLRGAALFLRFAPGVLGPMVLPGRPPEPQTAPPLVTPNPGPAPAPAEGLVPPAPTPVLPGFVPVPDAAMTPETEGFTGLFDEPAQVLERNTLRDRMIAEGLAAGIPPEATFPPGWEAHHIVPRGDNRFEEARAARDLLDALGIDVNDPANGVALPRAFHQRLHTPEYYAEIARGLAAAGGEPEARAYLRQVADTLRQRVLEAETRSGGE